MVYNLFHGFKLTEKDEGTKVFESTDNSVVGMVGTAKKLGKDSQGKDVVRNRPYLVFNEREAYALFGNALKLDEGSDTENEPYSNTLPKSLHAHFAQQGAAVVVICVDAPVKNTDAIITKLTLAKNDADTALKARKDEAKAAETKVTDLGKEVTAAEKALEDLKAVTPRAPAADLKAAEKKVTDAKKAQADATVIRDNTLGAVADAQLIFDGAAKALEDARNNKENYDFSQVIGGITAEGQYTGLKLLANVNREPVGTDRYGNPMMLSIVPKILIAPRLSQNKEVAMQLLAAAKGARGFAFIDCPDTFAEAKEHAQSITSQFATGTYPEIRLNTTVGQVPLSAVAAGVTSRTTRDKGYFVSPSNQEIFSVVSMSKGVEFNVEDPNSQANQLNNSGIMTVIREGAWRLWGNMTLSGDETDIYKFITVRRIMNELNDSAIKHHFWALDQNITKTYQSTVEASLQRKIDDMIAEGALLGGKASVSLDNNNVASIKLGKIKFRWEVTPVFPANEIEFESVTVDTYLQELIG